MEDCFLRGTDPDWSFKDAVPINRHIIWDNEGNTSKITLQLHSNHYPLIEAWAGYRRPAMQTPCLSFAEQYVAAFTEWRSLMVGESTPHLIMATRQVEMPNANPSWID